MMADKCYCCGFSEALDKHHPDGRVDTISIFPPPSSNAEILTFAIDDPLFEIAPKEDCVIKLRKQHLNPDNYIILCPNCHALIHRSGISVGQLKKNRSSRQTALKDYFTRMNKLFAQVRKDAKRRGMSKDTQALMGILEIETPIIERRLCEFSGSD